MQFRARLAQVTGAAPKDPEKPLTIMVKLEPTLLESPQWVFDHLGRYLVVELMEAPADRTPLEEAIDAAMGDDDDVLLPSNTRRRNGTRSSEQA